VITNLIGRLRSGAPDRFLAALGLALAFMVFLTADQIHWWRLKPDYAFGWLVPIFVVYLVVDRWPKLGALCQPGDPSPLPRWAKATVATAAGFALASGLVLFSLGALYRAGSGASQPGSMALAAGFPGVLLGMVFFNVPDGRVGEPEPSGLWRALRTDSRLRATALFLFPALIWIVSAPLASAVENMVSLFLLQKVVTVVFTTFGFLGYPLVREGNVLMLPHGSVGVADACSGIRSLTGCLFAGSFLAAVFLDRFWKKILLVGASMVFAFLTNLLRSLFLTAWAYAYGSEAIEGTLHDATGFAVLGLTCLGLFCLLPLFSGANWRRWLGAAVLAPAAATIAGHGQG
jgi:exosortase/archaeosortase family protein